MADMAYQIAVIRDAGIPKSSIETKLKKEVKDVQELSFSIVVINIVYSTEGSPLALKNEVLKRCKTK